MFIPFWLIVLGIVGLIYLLINVVKLRHLILRLKEIIFLLETGDISEEIKHRLTAGLRERDPTKKRPKDPESAMGDVDATGWGG